MLVVQETVMVIQQQVRIVSSLEVMVELLSQVLMAVAAVVAPMVMAATEEMSTIPAVLVHSAAVAAVVDTAV